MGRAPVQMMSFTLTATQSQPMDSKSPVSCARTLFEPTPSVDMASERRSLSGRTAAKNPPGTGDAPTPSANAEVCDTQWSRPERPLAASSVSTPEDA